MTHRLIAALADAARQTREDRGISRARVADALGKSEDTVRYFENATAYGGLDDMIEAYEKVGVSLFDLLDEVKANLKKNG